MKEKEGTVYFLAPEHPIKIGFTEGDIYTRISELQVASPHQLKLVRAFKGNKAHEKWLHEYFKHRHIRGEWFRYEESMMAIIPPDVKHLRWSTPRTGWWTVECPDPLVQNWPKDPYPFNDL